MKHVMARTFTLLAVTLVGLALAAPAQTTHVVKVTVPFEFAVGEQTFPAGDYSIVETDQNRVTLRDARGYTLAQAFTVGIESNSFFEDTKLRFSNAAGMHILTEVWDGAALTGQQLTGAKAHALAARRRSADSSDAAETIQP